MSIMLMLLLALICVQESLPLRNRPGARWPEPPAWLTYRLGDLGSLLATAVVLILAWAVGSLLTGSYCRAIRRDPSQCRKLHRRFQARQKLCMLLMAGGFLAALYFLGWGHVIRKFWGDAERGGAEQMTSFLPGKELVLLAPFLIGLVCSWARFYDLEKTVHDVDSSSPFISRWAYLGLQARFNLLLIMPPLVLLLARQTVLWLVPVLRENDAFVPFFFTAFLLAALLGMPWLLRLYLGLKPLPQGPLRERLEATARRLHCRCSDILLWHTCHSSANAFVTGVMPWARYIVLTDQLLRDLSPEEVEAVLGHEIGHVKHHHMFFYMLFLFGSLLALGSLWQVFESYHAETSQFLQEYTPMPPTWLEACEDFRAIPALLALALYLFVVFGYLSRWCETQADIFGSHTVTSDVFISALEKVAVLNGIPREKPGWLASWRHPTIARRVDFLQRMKEDSGLEPRFQRRIGLFKWSLTLVLVLVVATLLLGEKYFEKAVKPPAKTDAQAMRPDRF